MPRYPQRTDSDQGRFILTEYVLLSLCSLIGQEKRTENALFYILQNRGNPDAVAYPSNTHTHPAYE